MQLLINEFSDITPLGGEGFENVSLAFHRDLGRKVVLKKFMVTTEQPATNMPKRLEYQATAAGDLDHEHIIKVFGFGKDSQSFFIAMEYIDGWDLGRLMQWSPFPKEIGLLVLHQSISGLHYAHSRGITHYNLKPANILISKTGKVKVTDFGIDHARPHATAFDRSSSDFMTLNYMPPEVAAGSKDRTVSMDIWSTGVLAYHSICGSLPFVGSDFQKLVISILRDDPQDVRVAYPALPEELAAEISACLEKNPENRPRSLDRLQRSLAKFLFDLELRDPEALIKNYCADKHAAGRNLETLASRYNEKRRDPLLAVPISPTHLSESKLNMRPRDGSTSDESREGKPLYSLQRIIKFFPFKYLIPALVIALVAAAAAAWLLASRHNTHPATLSPPVNSLTKDLSREFDSPIRKEATHPPPPAENKPASNGAAAPLHANSVKANPKQFGVTAGSKGTTSGQARIAVPRTRNSVRAFENKINDMAPLNSAGSQFQTTPSTQQSATETAGEEKRKGTGTLHIHSYPWAEIYIDNVYQGTSPTPQPIPLPEGEHSVVLKREGFKPYSETVYIVKDDEKRLKVRLEH